MVIVLMLLSKIGKFREDAVVHMNLVTYSGETHERIYQITNIR